MEDVSVAGMLVRTILSFGLVLGLLLLGIRLLRRTTGAGAGGGRAKVVEVVDRHGVGRNAAVVVVRVAGNPLVLGVTETQVSVLAEVDPDALAAHVEQVTEAAAAQGTLGPLGSLGSLNGRRPDLRAALDAVRELTIRRR